MTLLLLSLSLSVTSSRPPAHSLSHLLALSHTLALYPYLSLSPPPAIMYHGTEHAERRHRCRRESDIPESASFGSRLIETNNTPPLYNGSFSATLFTVSSSGNIRIIMWHLRDKSGCDRDSIDPAVGPKHLWPPLYHAS